VKCCVQFVIVLLLPVLAWAQSAKLPEVTTWPENRTAAISLTFDDGLLSQLRNVGPILKRRHLHGTFFVITGSKTWLGHLDEWRRLAEEGNEIGSHSVHHPCMLPQIKPHSEDYTPEMMKAEIQQSAHAIIAALETHRGLTFAYPCDNETFGPPWDDTRNQVRYLSFVAEFYFAARMDNGGLPNNPPELNPLTVHGLNRTVGLDFPRLQTMMEPVLSSHQWGVYEFHGVGGDHLAISAEAFDGLASYLQQHGEIWCATFGDVVRYIQERRALEIKPAESDDRRVQFKLRWPLEFRVYDLPLTLN
jgi:peptidoglycan/xylan/chitin deacetylase (PgdA/CDA1 family)